MKPQQPLQLSTEVPEHGQGHLDAERGRFQIGDPLPALCDAHDLARFFSCSLPTIYTWSKQGELRRFELHRPLGAKKWSGRKLLAYADGAVSGLGLVRNPPQGRRRPRVAGPGQVVRKAS